MLQYVRAFSGFSVDDISAAKAFYGETLGLDVVDGPMGNITINLVGGTHLFIYPKADHTPATFTILNFVVDNVERTVDELTAAGVAFEHYDMPVGSMDDKGIVRGEGPTIAWFKDPAGNVLSVLDQ